MLIVMHTLYDVNFSSLDILSSAKHGEYKYQPTYGHCPSPSVQNAGHIPCANMLILIRLENEAERSSPHPQGAFFKSRINNPVLYRLFVEIRTLTNASDVSFPEPT